MLVKVVYPERKGCFHWGSIDCESSLVSRDHRPYSRPLHFSVPALRDGKFQDAWNLLESCENAIESLDRHFIEEGSAFGIEHARIHTKQLQGLYPLTWAVSPAFLYKEVRCSICKTKLTLRSGCDHIGGEIYDGEMCGRVVTGWELLHVALVRNPVQKFSFIFPEGDDDRPFRPIKELATAIGSPWHRWSYYKEERRQFHPAFRD